jgi:hypothetical protein
MRLCAGVIAQLMYLCRANGTHKNTIVESIIKSVDPIFASEYQVGSSDVNRLFNCKSGSGSGSKSHNSGGKHFTNLVKIAPTADYDVVCNSMASGLVNVLDIDKKELLVLALLDIVRRDSVISDEKAKSFEHYVKTSKQSLLEKDIFVLSELMAGLFLYALAATDNTVGRGCDLQECDVAKALADAYKHRSKIDEYKPEYNAAIHNAIDACGKDCVLCLDDRYLNSFTSQKNEICVYYSTDDLPGNSTDDNSTFNFNSVVSTAVSEDDKTAILKRFSVCFEKCVLEMSDRLPGLSRAATKLNTFGWIKKLMQGLEPDVVGMLDETLTEVVCLATALRSYILENRYNKINADEMKELDSLLHPEITIAQTKLPTEVLIALSQTDTFEQFSRISNNAFFRGSDGEKTVISFAALSIFFTNLYLILSRYANEYKDLIRFKTNVNLNLEDFGNHIPPHHISIEPDLNKRRIDVCMLCDEAVSHKAAVLFVNEFERALSSFEDVFSYIGFKVYYIRAKIRAFGSDNVSNHNFEAYTPTLMPLLAGGHLYGTNLVFIRELVQNAIDSVSTRLFMDGKTFSPDINVGIEVSDNADYITSLTVKDFGLGMSRTDIERYLTSIGRSFYTASDFKKLNIDYKPISSFGIGFLSCFLVCKNISIRSHKQDGSDESCELSIPNIEGCFFVENSTEPFPIGTEVRVEVDDNDREREVSLAALMDFADSHFLDVRFDINLSWDKRGFSLLDLNDKDGNQFNTFNSDIKELAKNNIQKPPCRFAFVNGGILAESEKVRAFRLDWWNRYLREKLEGIELREVRDRDNVFSHTICKHAIRKVGKDFFIFIPFDENGTVFPTDCDTIESTYDYPYGIFITDVPFAGLKLRTENNGVLPCSGRLVFLNAGILIDEAELKPLFGQEMRIYSQETETAYNNVIINLPPNWVELNVARDRIIALSTNVDKRLLLKGIAKSALTALFRLMRQETGFSLINIQEAATFIEVICSELNNNKTTEDMEMLVALKKLKFLQRMELTDIGVRFFLTEDNGDSTDTREFFERHNDRRFNVIPSGSYKLISPDFFREFEIQLGKKRIESLDEFDDKLADKFNVPISIRQRLNHNLTLVMFAAYILLFPEARIEGKYAKANHSRLALEWQLIKKFTTTAFIDDKCSEIVTFAEITEFLIGMNPQTEGSL